MKTFKAVIDIAKFDAIELDHVDLDTLRRQTVDERLDEPGGIMVEEARSVDEVNADNSERLLLQLVGLVPHAHVNDDLRRLVSRMRLEFNTHPAVAFIGAFVIPRRDGIGEREKSSRIAAASGETFDV